MNHKDAVDMAARMNKHAELTATIVRILPEHVDPPKLSDNGWDVEIRQECQRINERVFEKVASNKPLEI